MMMAEMVSRRYVTQEQRDGATAQARQDPTMVPRTARKQ